MNKRLISDLDIIFITFLIFLSISCNQVNALLRGPFAYLSPFIFLLTPALPVPLFYQAESRASEGPHLNSQRSQLVRAKLKATCWGVAECDSLGRSQRRRPKTKVFLFFSAERCGKQNNQPCRQQLSMSTKR